LSADTITKQLTTCTVEMVIYQEFLLSHFSAIRNTICWL